MKNIEDQKSHRKLPFIVPDHYFEHLTDQIMEHVEQQQRSKTSFMVLLKPYLGLVAMFGIALLLAQLVFWLAPDKTRVNIRVTDSILSVNANVELEEQFNPSEEEIVAYLISEMTNTDLTMALLERSDWSE